MKKILKLIVAIFVLFSANTFAQTTNDPIAGVLEDYLSAYTITTTDSETGETTTSSAILEVDNGYLKLSKDGYYNDPLLYFGHGGNIRDFTDRMEISKSGGRKVAIYNGTTYNFQNFQNSHDIEIGGNLEVNGVVNDDLEIATNTKLTFGLDEPNSGHLKIYNSSGCYNTYAIFKGNIYFGPEGSSSTLGIQKNGTVTIGVWEKYDNTVADTKGNKLMVNGNILCQKVTVESDVPNSDYVFEPDYNLLSLEEIEAFVKQNKHLPEVPSAAEFKENGYSVGEMDDLLLRKIEELTLYIIEQEKRIKELEDKKN